MAFPKDVARSLELGTPEIVEDLKLGLDLVLQGHRPGFCERALVESGFPESEDATRQQRTRWEHGYLGQMRIMLPRLLLRGLTGRPLAMASFLDLLVPPLSLLLMASWMVVLGLFADFLIRMDPMPLSCVTASIGFAAMALTACWLRFGRDALSIGDILHIPAYALRKLSMYLAVPFGSESEWKRTERVK
jgi:cellulose synthase/poly-beta-1,6-N-acetylglucosamine synthase-like glycosyltransferase